MNYTSSTSDLGICNVRFLSVAIAQSQKTPAEKQRRNRIVTTCSLVYSYIYAVSASDADDCLLSRSSQWSQQQQPSSETAAIRHSPRDRSRLRLMRECSHEEKKKVKKEDGVEDVKKGSHWRFTSRQPPHSPRRLFSFHGDRSKVNNSFDWKTENSSLLFLHNLPAPCTCHRWLQPICQPGGTHTHTWCWNTVFQT